MYKDRSTRDSRMKRVPDAKLRDYLVPMLGAIIALPFVYSFVVIYSIVLAAWTI